MLTLYLPTVMSAFYIGLLAFLLLPQVSKETTWAAAVPQITVQRVTHMR